MIVNDIHNQNKSHALLMVRVKAKLKCSEVLTLRATKSITTICLLKSESLMGSARHRKQRTSVFTVYPAVLHSVCYYSDVVFETGSPADGGDASVFVVVKNRLEQTPLQTNLSFKVDTEHACLNRTVFVVSINMNVGTTVIAVVDCNIKRRNLFWLGFEEEDKDKKMWLIRSCKVENMETLRLAALLPSSLHLSLPLFLPPLSFCLFSISLLHKCSVVLLCEE